MRTSYIHRLIGRITASNQSNNDTFTFYGHRINLQSGTPDYVSVTIYCTTDPYSGELADFNFDYLSKELCIEYAENEEFSNAMATSFRNIYACIKLTE